MALPRSPSSLAGERSATAVPRDSKGPARATSRASRQGSEGGEALHAPPGRHTASGVAPDSVPRAQHAPPVLHGEAGSSADRTRRTLGAMMFYKSISQNLPL